MTTRTILAFAVCCFSGCLLASETITDSVDVVDRAVTEGGWLAGLLAVLVLGSLGLFGYFLRGDKAEARETQKFIRTEMANVIDGNTIVVGRLIGTLRDRPCLHDSDLTKLEAGNGSKMTDAELTELDVATRKAVDRVKRRERRRDKVDDEATP